MSAFDEGAGSVPTPTERSHQVIRDPARSDHYGNDVAQRHQNRSRLSRVVETGPPPASDISSLTSERESDVTSALTVPEGAQLASWPGKLPGADPLPGQLDRWLAARGAELVAIRRHIHAHPELSHQEFETAALIARELAVAGLSPRLLPKGNGVICDIGTGERVIAFRADLDALPLHDTKDVPYRSTVEKAAHACGHDVHTTVLLGLGLALAQLDERGELPGRVRLIFQPAEETVPSGAPEVIAAGGLKDVAGDLRAALLPATAGRPGRRPVRPVHRGRRHRRGTAHRPRRAHRPAAPHRRPGARARPGHRGRAVAAGPPGRPAGRGVHGVGHGARRRGVQRDPRRGLRQGHRPDPQPGRLARSPSR